MAKIAKIAKSESDHVTTSSSRWRYSTPVCSCSNKQNRVTVINRRPMSGRGPSGYGGGGGSGGGGGDDRIPKKKSKFSSSQPPPPPAPASGGGWARDRNHNQHHRQDGGDGAGRSNHYSNGGGGGGRYRDKEDRDRGGGRWRDDQRRRDDHRYESHPQNDSRYEHDRYSADMRKRHSSDWASGGRSELDNSHGSSRGYGHTSSGDGWGPYGTKRAKKEEFQQPQYRQQQRYGSRSGGGGGWSSTSAAAAATAAPAAMKDESTSTSANAGKASTSSIASWKPPSTKNDDNNEQAQAQLKNDSDDGEIKPLDEIVTKETWDDCSWDQKIASQHPDWPMDHRTGKSYLRPGQKVESILTTCPFAALKEGSKSGEWFAKKVKAAKDAFEKAWDDDNSFNSPKEEVQRFFEALPYNMTFLIGWDVIGIRAKDENHCLCPCSSKCAKWRRQFDLDVILDDFGPRDQCGNTMKSSQPFGIMQHLDQKGPLHQFVKMYIQELYGPPYCGKVGHKGLYPKSSKQCDLAVAYENMKNFQARKKLEKEVEEQRRATLKLEEEAEKRKKDLEELKKLTKDQYERLQAEEEDRKLLNLVPAKTNENEEEEENEEEAASHTNSTMIFRDMCRAFFEGIKWGVDRGKGYGGSVDIHVPNAFKAEALFDQLSEGRNICFLFRPLDYRNENVGGKIFKDWNIIFDTVSNHEKVKQETQAIDEGGPSREFMALIWRRFTKLRVRVEGSGGVVVQIPLVYRDDTGYALFQRDADIEECLNLVPGNEQEEARQKVEMYYQAIGRLFLHALSMDTPIPTTALPPFYRNYLLRDCGPGDYHSRDDLYREIKMMDSVTDAKTIVKSAYTPDMYFEDGDHEGYTTETFFSKFIPKFYVDSRNIALTNVRRGLTLDERIPLSRLYKAISPKELETIAFSNPEMTPDHVIVFLKPVYCDEISFFNEETNDIVFLPVEQQLMDEQKLFFEHTLPNVLRERYLAEKEDEESYKKKVRRKRDFLSRFVQYSTGSHYLPHPDIKNDSDMIKIEFNASEVSEDSLPEAHTCNNTLKFPHTAYSNDSELLAGRLGKAFRLTSKYGSFGMQ